MDIIMDERLNVCLLSDTFPPAIDGVANAVLNYANILHGEYGGAIVTAPGYPGESDEYPFPIIRYPSILAPATPGIGIGFSVPDIVSEIRKHPVGIIHFHCPFVSAVISKALWHATGAPAIMTYHTKHDVDIMNSSDSELMQDAVRQLIVAGTEWCDEVWASSRGAGENLRSLGYEGDYRIMENGVDFQKGPVDAGSCYMVSVEHSLPPELPLFLYVGRMVWHEGIRLILDSLLKAKASGARFKMIFVGTGDDYEAIQRLAYVHGLKKECIFTGPIKDREKLRAYFSRADMLLFPSTFDTNGIAVREAAACGLASILVRNSAAAEPVSEGRNAVLIEEDSNNLAGAIIHLSRNRGYMKSLGIHAMEDLYLPWDTAVKKAHTRYHELLEEKSQPFAPST